MLQIINVLQTSSLLEGKQTSTSLVVIFFCLILSRKGVEYKVVPFNCREAHNVMPSVSRSQFLTVNTFYCSCKYIFYKCNK